MRLVAFTDYVYRQRDGVVYGERAFAVFLGALADQVEQLTIVGRLDPGSGPCHYALPRRVRFVALPHYRSLTQPVAVVSSLARSLVRFWRALEDADRVWLLGPYPHALAFALLARLRRRRLILGVRQDFPQYVRSRRPARRWMHVAADLLEYAWRLLARGSAVVVVGPELARHYSHAPALLEIAVSLVSERDIERASLQPARAYDGELQILSVGRIDREKNPLLLALILKILRDRDSRWRMVICGEGPLTDQLSREFVRLGLAGACEMRGYVPIDGGLLELYQASHVFLHVSLTEGMPQVLIEAYAARLPVVATAVGGVPEAAGDAAILIPPDDASAAASALERVVSEPELRERLIQSGVERAQLHTLEGESERVAGFIADGRALPRHASPAHTLAG